MTDTEARQYAFFDMIKAHDYYFTYADDHRAYVKGNESRKKILLHIEQCPQDGWIWRNYCISVERGKWPNTLEDLRDD